MSDSLKPDEKPQQSTEENKQVELQDLEQELSADQMQEEKGGATNYWKIFQPSRSIRRGS